MITSLEPIPKIPDSSVHQRHDVTTFGAKSGKAQYEKSQQYRKNRKSKRDGKDGEGERDRKSH